MAADLILSSESTSNCIDKLEESLRELAPSDRLQWSLKRELLADASSSRVSEAALSQPLSTAIQILLVDILFAADIRFKAFVGHSSGEIAATYAAGFICARDAIRIAYYRGLHSRLAAGKDGVKGAMIAVATSREDAQELCEMDEFRGRITIAAVNSAANVTLSGDQDAIAEAKIIFTDEKKNVENALLQPEGMRAVPLAGAKSNNDINLFSSMTWGPASLDAEAVVWPLSSLIRGIRSCIYTLERVATFYLRFLDQTTPDSHPARTTGAYVGYFDYATYVISQVSAGRHPYAKKDWMSDTLEHILSTSEAFPKSPDLKIMHIVGREMPRVIRGETKFWSISYLTAFLTVITPMRLDFPSSPLGFRK